MSSRNDSKDSIVQASYNDDIAPIYRGNPFIEALPRYDTIEKISAAIRRVPPYEDQWRRLPDAQRLESLPTLRQLYVPRNQDIDIFRRLYSELYASYHGRGVSDPHYFQKVVRQNEDSPPDVITNGALAYSSASLPIIGLSGSGKTSAVSSYLNAIPVAIRHARYKRRPFLTTQMPWIRLTCPSDGSPKTLCAQFFYAMDAPLDTRYAERFIKERSSASGRLGHIRRLAALHGVGVVVIDNLENLAPLGLNGFDGMMNFIFDIMDTLRVVVVLVGTYEIQPFITKSLREIRRVCDLGWLPWDRLEGSDLNRYIETLWKFQYTRSVTKLTPELFDAMVHESVGIPGIATPLYKLVQERAITTRGKNGTEIITPALIHSVASDHFAVLDKPLKAIRSGVQERDIKFPDIFSRLTDRLMQKMGGKDLSLCETEKSFRSTNGIEAEVTAGTKNKVANPKRTCRDSSEKNDPASFLNIVRQKNDKTTSYDALANAGVFGVVQTGGGG